VINYFASRDYMLVHHIAAHHSQWQALSQQLQSKVAPVLSNDGNKYVSRMEII